MKISDDDWRKYRDTAPESVDDESLMTLISKNNGNSILIAAAIENLWNDQPEHRETTTWTSTSKPKKNVSVEEKRFSHSHSKTNRDKTTKLSTAQNGERLKVSVASQVMKPKIEQAIFPVKEIIKFTKQNSTSVNGSVTGVQNNGLAWKDSKNFAQKLKEQLSSVPDPVIESQSFTSTDLEELHHHDIVNVTEEIEQETESKLSSSVTLSESRQDTEAFLSSVVSGLQIIDDTLSVSAVDVPTISLEENFSSQENILDLNSFNKITVDPEIVHEESPDDHSTQYLNLGKWEKPVESSDSRGGFQFGTFGSDDSNRSTQSWSDVKHSDQSTSQSWQPNVVQTNNVDLPVPPATSMNGSDISSLFPIQTQKQSSDVQINASSRYDPSKNIIPPGLEPQNQMKNLNKLQKNNVQSNQPRKNDMPPHVQNPYQNPNLFPPQIGNANIQSVRGNIVSTPSLVPPFYTGFDVSGSSAAQYVQPYPSNNATSGGGPSATVSPNVNASNVISTPPGATNTAGIPQPNQQQPSFAPPPGMTSAYGYYPYGFPNQAYYYSQPNVPNYYGQNRSVYQNARTSFQNDPYGNNGNMYADVYASGQFQDSSSTYGHPTNIPQPIAGINSVNNISNNIPNSKQKNGPVTVNQQQLPPQSDVNSYSYNPYTANRGTADQSWQFQNSNQGWGQQHPMMPFPVNNQNGNGSNMPQNNGFMTQGNPISQQQQNSRDPNPRSNNVPQPSTGYNGNVFNNRGGTVNPAPPGQW